MLILGFFLGLIAGVGTIAYLFLTRKLVLERNEARPGVTVIRSPNEGGIDFYLEVNADMIFDAVKEKIEKVKEWEQNKTAEPELEAKADRTGDWLVEEYPEIKDWKPGDLFRLHDESEDDDDTPLNVRFRSISGDGDVFLTNVSRKVGVDLMHMDIDFLFDYYYNITMRERKAAAFTKSLYGSPNDDPSVTQINS